MNKEDYFKYYIQGSDHYLIPKDVFDELFNEMSNWKEEAIKYKETKQKEFIDYLTSYIELLNNKADLIEEGQQDILKEVFDKFKEIIGDECK